MSYTPVDIHIKDRTPLGAGIAGVTVKVMTDDGKMVYGQAVSGANGLVSFLLPAPKVYQVRFYKFGVSFQNPTLIDVLDNGQLNAFNAYGTTYVQGQSIDARFCTASGFFRRPNGAAHVGLDIHFIAKFDPVLLDGAGMLAERVSVRTDLKGFASVPLVRFAQYDVTVEGMENIYRSVNVPDAPAVNLPDLLFPVVDSVVFDTSAPLALTVGQELEIDVQLFTTDLRELEELGTDVTWALSDPTIVTFEVRKNSLLFRGVNPGTCSLMVDRQDKSIIRIPNKPISGAPLAIVVT